MGLINSGPSEGTEVRSCEELSKSLGPGPKECGKFID